MSATKDNVEQMFKKVCDHVLLKATALQGVIKTHINSVMTESASTLSNFSTTSSANDSTSGQQSASSNNNPFKHRVFVYGTLKRGQPNYVHFETPEVHSALGTGHGQARYVCQARSLITYPLIIATRFNLPFLLHAPDRGKIIKGEIWEVDDDMFSFLDDFEGHPDLYERDRVTVAVDKEVQVQEDNAASGYNVTDLPNELECWCYFLKNFPPSLLSRKRSFSTYDAFGDHNMEYIGEDEDDFNNPDYNMYEELEREPADPGFESETETEAKNEEKETKTEGKNRTGQQQAKTSSSSKQLKDASETHTDDCNDDAAL